MSDPVDESPSVCHRLRLVPSGLQCGHGLHWIPDHYNSLKHCSPDDDDDHDHADDHDDPGLGSMHGYANDDDDLVLLISCWHIGTRKYAVVTSSSPS